MMLTQQIEYFAEELNRALESGVAFEVPEGHPLHAEQEYFACRLRAAVLGWPTKAYAHQVKAVMVREGTLSLEDLPSEKALREAVREILLIKWPAPAMEIALPARGQDIAQFGLLLPRQVAHAVMVVRPGTVLARPFWIAKVLFNLISAVAEHNQVAMVAVLMDVFDGLIKMPKLTDQQRQVLIALIAARVRYRRAVSTLEVAAVQRDTTPLVLLNGVVDLHPMQAALSALSAEHGLAEMLGEIASDQRLDPAQRRPLQEEVIGRLPPTPSHPATGVWDTCEKWLSIKPLGVKRPKHGCGDEPF